MKKPKNKFASSPVIEDVIHRLHYYLSSNCFTWKIWGFAPCTYWYLLPPPPQIGEKKINKLYSLYRSKWNCSSRKQEYSWIVVSLFICFYNPLPSSVTVLYQIDSFSLPSPSLPVYFEFFLKNLGEAGPHLNHSGGGGAAPMGTPCLRLWGTAAFCLKLFEQII